jgi:hypothetical protein
MVIRMKTEEKSVMMVISITQMVVQMIVRIQDVETTSFKVLVKRSVMMEIPITQMIVQMIVRSQDVETTSCNVPVKRSVMMEVIMTQLHQHAILTVRYEMYVEMVR